MVILPGEQGHVLGPHLLFPRQQAVEQQRPQPVPLILGRDAQTCEVAPAGFLRVDGAGKARAGIVLQANQQIHVGFPCCRNFR